MASLFNWSPRGELSDRENLLSPQVRTHLETLSKEHVDPEQSVFFVSAPAHELHAKDVPRAASMIGRHHGLKRTGSPMVGWNECNAFDEVWVPSPIFNLRNFCSIGRVRQRKLRIPTGSIDHGPLQGPGPGALANSGHSRGFNSCRFSIGRMRKGYDVLLRAYCSEFRSAGRRPSRSIPESVDGKSSAGPTCGSGELFHRAYAAHEAGAIAEYRAS